MMFLTTVLTQNIPVPYKKFRWTVLTAASLDKPHTGCQETLVTHRLPVLMIQACHPSYRRGVLTKVDKKLEICLSNFVSLCLKMKHERRARAIIKR